MGNIQVIIKQEGTPNGIKNWVSSRFTHSFSEKNTSEFITKLEEVSGFSQEAYNLLIEELKLIRQKGKHFDNLNPQNILLDNKNNTFNIIDIENSPIFSDFLIPIRILSSLMDGFNFLKAYQLANKSQKEQIIKAEIEIRKKIKLASKHNSLTYDERKFDDEFNYQQRILEHKKSGKSSSPWENMLNTLLARF